VNTKFEKLILASRSPRRAAILDSVGWPYEIVVSGVDETVLQNEDAVTYVQRLALAKANAVATNLTAGLILGADTTVVIDNQILGQPLDRDDALSMLRLLSGRWHEVLTGVAVVRAGTSQHAVAHEVTRVRFAELTEDELNWYIETGEPFDKAGGYGIQGHAALFVKQIDGDYFNIMGLPIRLVYESVQQVQTSNVPPSTLMA